MIKKMLFVLCLLLLAGFSYSQDNVIIDDEIKKEEPVNLAVIEKVPSFPGCEGIENEKNLSCFNTKMAEHINATLEYPSIARRRKIEGKVLVIFEINKNGDVANIQTRGGDPILQTEALRIIKLLPKMKPGIQKGKPVNVKYAIPIIFKIQ